MNSRRTIFFVSTILVAASAAFLVWPRAAMTQQGQSPQKQQTPTIDEYQPKSTLVTKEHKIERAKFPFIDIHSHTWNPKPEEVERLVKEMDTIKLRVMVNLSGGTEGRLQRTVAATKRGFPDWFVLFSTLSNDG